MSFVFVIEKHSVYCAAATNFLKLVEANFISRRSRYESDGQSQACHCGGHGSIAKHLRWTKWQSQRFSSDCLDFSLVVSVSKCCILIFRLTVLSSEGQAGENLQTRRCIFEHQSPLEGKVLSCCSFFLFQAICPSNWVLPCQYHFTRASTLIFIYKTILFSIQK